MDINAKISHSEIDEHIISKNNIEINISIWRSAELQCIEIEKYLFGNNAKDVSKQNKGYDVESIDKNGKMKYIEVKSIKSDNDYFALTNNEYTTAHMHG